MKIKTVKKIRLDELIKYVWENEVYPSVWRSEESPIDGWTIQFFEDGMFRSYNGFHDCDTFTVEVKEDLTEETELSGVTTFIRKSNGIFPVYTASASIRECLDSLTDVENEPLKIFNGITEIWNKDTGIPESGALEVDVE